MRFDGKGLSCDWGSGMALCVCVYVVFDSLCGVIVVMECLSGCENAFPSSFWG